MSNDSGQLDLGAAWNDALALMAANRDILFIVGGVFIFLPSIIVALILGDPPLGAAGTPDQLQQVILDWLLGAWFYLLAASLISTLGTLAIAYVVLNPAKPTVGDALKLGGGVLIFYLIAKILGGIAVGFGIFLLIIPGIYFAVKFSLTTMVVAAENERNPLDMLRRSWSLTKGNSLRLFGLYFIIGFAAVVSILVISLVLGTILTLILPNEIAALTLAVVDTILQTGYSLLMLHISIAAYRQLSQF